MSSGLFYIQYTQKRLCYQDIAAQVKMCLYFVLPKLLDSERVILMRIDWLLQFPILALVLYLQDCFFHL